MSLKFKGTQIRLYGDKKSAWGKETVYIDGVKQNQPADFTARTGNISNALVYASPALSYGKHTIEVEGAACTFTLKNAEIINHGPAPQLVATVDDAVTQGEHLSLIHISEPTRLGMISYAVFCLKKKKRI